jgi:nucleotide-binding universal stress UspA family protein
VFDRVLIPLDGSPRAEAVLPRLRRLLQAKPAEILLVQAVTLPVGVELEAAQVLAAEHAQAVSYLEALARRLAGEGLRARPIVRSGGAGEAILDVVEQEKPDLVAMTSHGRSGIARWILGSVAEKLLRASPVPVLALRSFEASGAPAVDRELRRILVGVGSDGALEVLDAVIALAKPFGAHVLLLNVCEGHPQCAVPVPWMTRAYERIAAAGLTAEPLMKVGEAAHEILEASKEQSVDLVALTTHGRKGPSRWLLGSVAERLLRSSTLPLLVVRGKVLTN